MYFVCVLFFAMEGRKPLASVEASDEKVTKLHVMSVVPQDDVAGVFKFEAFYFSIQLYYFVLQNFHVFYFVRSMAHPLCL